MKVVRQVAGCKAIEAATEVLHFYGLVCQTPSVSDAIQRAGYAPDGGLQLAPTIWHPAVFSKFGIPTLLKVLINGKAFIAAAGIVGCVRHVSQTASQLNCLMVMQCILLVSSVLGCDRLPIAFVFTLTSPYNPYVWCCQWRVHRCSSCISCWSAIVVHGNFDCVVHFLSRRDGVRVVEEDSIRGFDRSNGDSRVKLREAK